MPLSILPTQPRYCRCTPGVLVPDLRAEVSSISPTVPRSSSGKPAKAAATWRCSCSRTCGVVATVVAEELLQGADGTAGGQGDRLDALAFQVGEQAAAVGVQVAEGLGVAAAEQVRLQEIIEGGPQPVQFFFRHGSCLLAGLLLFANGKIVASPHLSVGR